METGDRKLNEVKKVTDMAYVPVIMADGSIGQIAKSDLASVVAGVMGTKNDKYIGSCVGKVAKLSINSTYKFGTVLATVYYGNDVIELLISISKSQKPYVKKITSNTGRVVYVMYDEQYNVYIKPDNVMNNQIGISQIGGSTDVVVDMTGITENDYASISSNLHSADLFFDTSFGYNSLAELAGGVAGVLGNPIGYKHTVIKNADLDTTLTTGYYNLALDGFVVGGTQRSFYGTLIVYESNLYIIQSGYGANGTILRRYNKTTKVFGEWYVFDNFGCNTLDDLAAALKPKLGLS